MADFTPIIYPKFSKSFRNFLKFFSRYFLKMSINSFSNFFDLKFPKILFNLDKVYSKFSQILLVMYMETFKTVHKTSYNI